MSEWIIRAVKARVVVPTKAELTNNLQQAKRAVFAAEREIIKEAKKTEDHKKFSQSVRDVSNGEILGDFSVLFTGIATLDVEITYPQKATESPKPNPEYIDPKTMNQLLNSKLLSDEEKREMLIERGILKASKPTIPAT